MYNGFSYFKFENLGLDQGLKKKFPRPMYCMSNKVSVGNVIQWTEEITDTTVWSSFKSWCAKHLNY